MKEKVVCRLFSAEVCDPREIISHEGGVAIARFFGLTISSDSKETSYGE